MTPVPLDKIQDQLGHIRSSARQLTDMVNDLISDAMMDALDIAIRSEPIDLAAMLGEIVTVEPRAGREEEPDHPSRVAAAPDVELRSRPAARGGRQSGQQRHQVQPDRRQHRAVDERRRRWRPSSACKDEGPGLSQDDMSRLFGRFQRLSAKPTGGESSTGLGLSIVKRIVELHGGTRQRRKRRARAAARPSPSACRRRADMNTPRSQHIVVVDDEAPAREMVGDYLRLHGFEVTLVRRRREPARKRSPSRRPT